MKRNTQHPSHVLARGIVMALCMLCNVLTEGTHRLYTPTIRKRNQQYDAGKESSAEMGFLKLWVCSGTWVNCRPSVGARNSGGASFVIAITTSVKFLSEQCGTCQDSTTHVNRCQLPTVAPLIQKGSKLPSCCAQERNVLPFETECALLRNGSSAEDDKRIDHKRARSSIHLGRIGVNNPMTSMTCTTLQIWCQGESSLVFRKLRKRTSEWLVVSSCHAAGQRS